MTPRKNRRTDGKHAFPGAALLLAALLPAGACGGHPPAPTAAGAVTLKAELAQAQRTEAPSVIELFGTVEAESTAAVSTRVMAMVTAVRVQTGDAVRKGQPLLDIDPQAAQGQLSQAAGALTQAQAGMALAERNHERYKALAEADAASQLELDMARTQYEQARGAVEQAEGAVASASSIAADSRVIAPFAGRVAQRMVEVGDLAAPGRPLLMLESEGGQRLALAIPEGVMAQSRLAIGDSLAVRIDSRPDLGVLEGRVVEKTPGADPASHTFRVELALPVEGISSGASGRAQLEIDRRTVVAIPAAAVLRQGGLTLVVVRDPEGRAASRVVTLGEPLADERIEVLSGLAGGETLALGLGSMPPAGAYLESVQEPGAERPSAEEPGEQAS